MVNTVYTIAGVVAIAVAIGVLVAILLL